MDLSLENTRPRHAAKACSSCARAKVRCVKSNAKQACDRCVRLTKDCGPQRSAPRRPPVPRTRFGLLEQRVDRLAHSLDRETHTSEIQETPQDVFLDVHGANSSTLHADNVWPSDDQAERLLAIFKDKLSDHFPFVAPPSQSASHFRRGRPFLFQAMVMAASYQDRRVQKRRGKSFIEELSRRLLVDGVKSLDLLQGLLIHIAWYHCHLEGSSQMTNLLQLSIAILADLGLNKPAHANDRRKLIFDASRSSYGFTVDTKTTTNEERRALLGCFYLSSLASTVFQRVEALSYTHHMDAALRALVDANEYAGDALLAQLVRVQQLVQQMAEVVPYDEPQSSRGSVAPLTMHLRSLERSLQEFQNSLPPSLQNHGFLLMHLHSSRIFLFEVGLYDSPWLSATDPKRLDVLWACLESLRSYFEVFLAFQEDKFFSLPYSLWGQLAHSLLITSRLSLLGVQGLNGILIENELQFCVVMDKVKYKLQIANAFAEATWLAGNRDGLINGVLEKLERIRKWFQEYTASEGHVPDLTGSDRPDGDGSGSGGAGTGREEDRQGSAWIDDAFWEELMSDYPPLTN